MKMTDSDTIRLRPFLIRPFGDEYFRVMRWGGNSKVVTRQLGVEALRHLKKGLSIREVRSQLAERYGSTSQQIDIRPLLKSLSSADLIARIGETPIPVRKGVTSRTLARFVWAVYGNPAARAIAENLRPIGAARLALEAMARAEMRKPFEPALDQARRNMDLVLGACAPGDRARRIREYYKHLILNIVDADMLSGCSAASVQGWLRRNVRIQGLEELEQAQRAKCGVILAVFHFGSTRLLPVILSLEGLSTTSIGPPTLGIGLRRTFTMFRAYDSMPGCGAIELLPGFDLGYVRTLVARLRAGGTAICMADVFSPSSPDGGSSEGARFFGDSSSGFPNGTTCVNLGRHSAHLTSWIGWLASVSGAAVIPTVIVRRGDRGLDLVFDQAIRAGAQGKRAAKTVNAALYQTFARYLARYPEQWFPWRILHRFSLHKAEQGDCESVLTGFRRSGDVRPELPA